MNLVKPCLKALLALLMVTTIFTTMAASMLSLDAAKTQGLVGEDANGYLAAVNAPDPEVSALLSSVNQARKAEYERIAKSNDIGLSDLELLAGRKAMEKSASGAYIRPQGSWMKKP
ncbi:MAG: YdbL family protein [Proteobacteria bacterium]|nr:YdbL family protein [Pseudomonadota bacterium]